MPFCTLKPNWYLRSGLLMSTVVTGGHLTMFSLILDWFFSPWGIRHTPWQEISPQFYIIASIGTQGLVQQWVQWQNNYRKKIINCNLMWANHNLSIENIHTLKYIPIKTCKAVHLDDALASGERKSNQTGAIDGHDLVSNIQSSRFFCWPSMHHVSNDDCRKDGAPAWLYNHHS